MVAYMTNEDKKTEKVLSRIEQWNLIFFKWLISLYTFLKQLIFQDLYIFKYLKLIIKSWSRVEISCTGLAISRFDISFFRFFFLVDRDSYSYSDSPYCSLSFEYDLEGEKSIPHKVGYNNEKSKLSDYGKPAFRPSSPRFWVRRKLGMCMLNWFIKSCFSNLFFKFDLIPLSVHYFGSQINIKVFTNYLLRMVTKART
jgi:hypothetical protein